MRTFEVNTPALHRDLSRPLSPVGGNMITLWTYQSARVLDLLQLQHWHTASWRMTGGDGWVDAFRWMASRMREFEIPIHHRPPVWAWHSIGTRGGKPTEEVGRTLLSDQQLENGILLMEIRVPRDLVVLSWYGAWNQVLDWYLDGAPGSPNRRVTL